MKKWLSFSLALVVVFSFVLFAVGSGEPDASVSKNDDSSDVGSSSNNGNSVSSGTLKVNVGETLDADGLKIKFVKCYEYKGYSKYNGPKDGYMVYCLELAVENTSSEDAFVSSFDFNCFADNAAMDDYWADDTLSATVSAGRKASGKIYFEVPRNAKSVEVEYDINYFNNKKAIFVVK